MASKSKFKTRDLNQYFTAKTFSSIAPYVCFVALSPAGVWISMIGVLLPSSNMRRESWHQSQQVAGGASRTSWLAESSPFRSSFHVRAVELAGAPFHLGHVSASTMRAYTFDFGSSNPGSERTRRTIFFLSWSRSDCTWSWVLQQVLDLSTLEWLHLDDECHFMIFQCRCAAHIHLW